MTIKKIVLIYEEVCVQRVNAVIIDNPLVISFDYNKVSHAGSVFPVRFNPTKEQYKLSLLVAETSAVALRDQIIEGVLRHHKKQAILYITTLEGAVYSDQ